MTQQYVQGGIFGGMTSQPLDWGSPWGSTPASQPVPWLDSLKPGPDNSPTVPVDWTALTTLPALPNPSAFAPSATSAGNIVTSQGGAGSVAPNVGANGAPAYAVGMPSNAQAGSSVAASSSGIKSGSLADYFLRGVVVVLGFIFIAVGLNMFRPGLVPVPGMTK